MTTTNRATERLRSIDELEKNILGLARQINVATYELLVMVREFDERAGFLKWSMKNTVEWLAWRIDISMSAAKREGAGRACVEKSCREFPLPLNRAS